MHHRKALPRRLGETFTVGQATAAGVGRYRSGTADLHRPFRGVRSTTVASDFDGLLHSCAERLKEGQRFGGRTAARHWGMPVDVFWRPVEPYEVMVPPNGAPPRTPGITGRRLKQQRAQTWRLDGVPVVDPVATLFTCAHELSLQQAVVMIDALVTDADDYPNLRWGRPAATLEVIARRLEEWGRFTGCGIIREALALARERVESPKETETRLLLVEAGLPEPVVQHEVRDGGRLVVRIDLAYPELKIAIEYEGDGHRTDPAQWRRDIQRQRELEARGWIVIRLTQEDLRDPRHLLRSIRSAIHARTA